MNLVWIVLAVAALGAIVKRVVWPRERGSQSDLGFVSHQWIAEHRLAKTHDAQR